VVLGGLPVLATVIALLLTRDGKATAPSAHDHAQMKAEAGPAPITIGPEAAKRIGVTFAVAREAKLEREIRVVGQVSYDERRVKIIAPKVEGWVERLYVDATGQEVRAGDRIMELYSPMLVAAEDELLLAKRLERDLAPADSTARARATSLVTAARSRLAAWDLSADDIARIERGGQAERTIVVRAPVSGFVFEKNVSQGQRVMAGDPIYKIVDLRNVWLEGEVYEQDLSAVRVGQTVNAEMQSLPGATFTAKVSFIYPTLNTETRTSRIRVELPNPTLRLKPGMGATLRLRASEDEKTLTVPRSAVLATGERHLVFVKRSDGRLEPREVVVGPATDQRITILAGLATGDTVVASATFLVDAEANLGTALGGMGDMPGMDITPPRKKE
jgi:Cu(I)/Ag(I) efflux system membrane fusion protein